ncbi:MAG: nitroreductase [Clostridiales Family XIII bacterium]|jgi:nitroreductase|nr:nitroreductase [Clostridiales Family XIII bacterium]
MDLYDCIQKRKSVRKYETAPLNPEQLNRIAQFAQSMKALYPNIEVAYEITSDVKTLISAKAPHYFAVSSEKRDGYLENVGFMFQQTVLYLTSLGLGTCWLGMAKPGKTLNTSLSPVIIIAFGKAVGSPYRDITEFKRKPLSEVSSGSDERLEAARLAPSALNNQNWFFAAAGGKIDVYQKKSIMDKTGKIDMGIAICHLYAATEHFGNEFVFSKETGKERTGYIYTGTIAGL